MSTPRSEARQPIATIRADHFTVFLLGAFSVIRGDARAMFIDDNATDEQFDALVAAYGGKLGGPLADLADLVGEILDVRRAPIRHEVRDGPAR